MLPTAFVYMLTFSPMSIRRRMLNSLQNTFLKLYQQILAIAIFSALAFSITVNAQVNEKIPVDSSLVYKNYTPHKNDIVISRAAYMDKLYGFWLGQCIANWTGLITEMDKIGSIGEVKTGAFYTRDDWGKPDQPSIWGQGLPSKISPTIVDFSSCKSESDIKELIEKNYLDKSTGGFMNYFKLYIKPGNYIIVSKGNLRFRAIGKITGDYEYRPSAEIGYYPSHSLSSRS